MARRVAVKQDDSLRAVLITKKHSYGGYYVRYEDGNSESGRRRQQDRAVLLEVECAERVELLPSVEG